MFFDGVFDNMDGMKFVPDGACIFVLHREAVLKLRETVPLEWFMVRKLSATLLGK